MSLAHSSSHRLLPKMYLLSFHRLATPFTSHCNCPNQHAYYCSQWCSFKLPARFVNKALQMFASTCILLQPVVSFEICWQLFLALTFFCIVFFFLPMRLVPRPCAAAKPKKICLEAPMSLPQRCLQMYCVATLYGSSFAL